MTEFRNLRKRVAPPTPKPELDGKLGYYLSELAIILEEPFKKVLECMTSLDFQCQLTEGRQQYVPFDNGVTLDYALEEQASHFFICKYDNVIGQKWCAALVRSVPEKDGFFGWS